MSILKGLRRAGKDVIEESNFRLCSTGHSFAELCELQSLLQDVFAFTIARCVEKFELTNAESFLPEPLSLVQALGLPLR